MTARVALAAALASVGYQALPGEADPLGLAVFEDRLDGLDERVDRLEAPESTGARAVEDCGLVCAGEHDDAPALNACLLARRHVVLPAGRTCAVRPTHSGGYLAVHMPSDSMLIGAGASSVLRVLPTLVGTQERMSRGVGAIGAVERVTLRDFAVRNEGPRMAAEQGHAVFFANGPRHLRVHDLDVLQSGGDAVYLGADVAFADVRGVVAVDVARNAVTIEGNSSAPRPGIRVSGVTRYYTPASDPTQRGGRLVDVETAGPGLSGLVVVGNTGDGGIEVGNVDRAVVVGNVADRFHGVNATRAVTVGNSLRALTDATTYSLQRATSGVVVGNWIERTRPGNAVSIERPELGSPPAPLADVLFVGNRWLYGDNNIRPTASDVVRLAERATVGAPPSGPTP
jgi:hypothetical protein